GTCRRSSFPPRSRPSIRPSPSSRPGRPCCRPTSPRTRHRRGDACCGGAQGAQNRSMRRPRSARFLGEVAFLVVVAAIAAVLHFGAVEIALAMAAAFVVVVVVEVASVREDAGAPRREARAPKLPPRPTEPVDDLALAP